MINSWAAGVVHPFASLLVSNGGELVADGKPALDSKQARRDVPALRGPDQVRRPAIRRWRTADANTTGPFLDNFVSGKTGMIIMANWWESALKGGMGDKFANIATAPIPVGPSGDRPRSISYSWMTVVNARRRRGRAEGGLGLPGLAERPEVRPERRLGHGRHPDVDGHPAVAHLRRRRPTRTSSARDVPRGLRQRARQRQAVPGRARRPGILARRCSRRSKPRSTARCRPRMRRRTPRPTPPRSWSAPPSSHPGQ